MAWWVYKCNSKNQPHQVVCGDWGWFFDRGRIGQWGSTESVPELIKLARDDSIICYQTDQNELVGICRVVRFQGSGESKRVYLEPLERIGVKVRPLKEASRKIASIPALQPGPIRTLYEISGRDALLLLKAAGSSYDVDGAFDEIRSDEVLLEKSFLEGEKRAGVATVRNPRLRVVAKKAWGLTCYCCGFNFEEFYGSVAKGLAIVHHLDLFDGRATQRRVTAVQDVRVVCANCHYVIHARCSPIHVDDLKRMISRRTRGTATASDRRSGE